MDSIASFCADYWWIVLILGIAQVYGLVLWMNHTDY